MDIRWLVVTVGTAEEAAHIGQTLLEEHQVACVNIVPQIRSLYRWEGKIQDDTEALLLAKTTVEQLPAAMKRIEALHSYECPCIVALDVDTGHAPFLEWVRQETGSRAPESSA